jgi:8-oxo-dGTP diphosphatase
VTDVVRAAGGIVRRLGEGGLDEVLVVHRPAYDDWTFPKGKLEPGEDEVDAAIREIEEEAGLRCEIERELATTRYRDSSGRPKTVRYWLMVPVGGRLGAANEVDVARFVQLDAARELLTYARDAELLDMLGHSVTKIHLIRHAKAKNRAEWTEPDNLRPLTKRGRREAEALAGRLHHERPLRLLSSPFRRCLETLAPLAEALDLPIETTDALSEGAGGDSALELLLAAIDEGPVVACTHGDVLFEAMRSVATSGVALPGPLDAPVASTWVLDIADGRVAAARFVERPET